MSGRLSAINETVYDITENSSLMKVGITGQAGFIGTHLYNTLGLYPEKFARVPFEDNYFESDQKLQKFVSECDAIVHLAAMNRHPDPQVIYNTNINLVNQVIKACESTQSRPHILFSSSSQEEKDNLYGKSKKEGRLLFEEWALLNNAKFTGMVIPNVFGPFGLPFYNSVVATFCHQLTHNEQPKIDVDGELKLIYVNELVEVILGKLSAVGNQQYCYCERSEPTAVTSIVIASEAKQSDDFFYQIPHTTTIKVSELLKKMEKFKTDYFEKGIFPNLDIAFDRNLFNTFQCYIDHQSFFPFTLIKRTDDRGSFVETVKLNSGGQVSFSTTLPGITRGNHFHTRKAERFAVIKGKALIELRKIDTNHVLSFKLDGESPSFVDMPVWYTHNITNIGNDELYTIFWINEFFNPEDPDTFIEKV